MLDIWEYFKENKKDILKDMFGAVIAFVGIIVLMFMLWAAQPI